MDKLEPGRAPIYEMLEQYRLKGNISYHVPGHKDGNAYSTGGGAGYLDEIMKYDVTEITGTDDLHHPEGVIQEAQELAADCFGAEESFLLVGGSTAGNLALILTVCPEPGMTLILQRNVHKSVIHGLMLAGVNAVFLEPQLDTDSGLAVAPEAEAVQAALAAYPEAAAVLVTMPNYYGMGTDLAPLARICHDHSVPLLVDEAHGAHYGQHPALPAGALACGADGVVQSTHKMLPALTMGAMLHVQGPRLDRALLRQRLAMVQSSSPSYPLMASLDLARRLVHTGRASAFTAGLAAVDVLKRGLAELPRFGLLQPPVQQQLPGGAGAVAAGTHAPPGQAAAYTAQDPFKAVIYDAAGVLGGFELQRRLEEKGIVPEMSDDRHVVLAFSLGSRAEDSAALLGALRQIAAEVPTGTSPSALKGPEAKPGLPELNQLEAALGQSALKGPEAKPGLPELNQSETVPGKSTPKRAEAKPGSSDLNQSEATAAPSGPNQAEAPLGLQPIAALPRPGNISTWNIFNRQHFSQPVRFSLKPVSAAETETVLLEYSVGRTAAEMVIPYPPGIPLLYPGEVINDTVYGRLIALSQGSAKFQACADPALQYILVYNNKKGGEV